MRTYICKGKGKIYKVEAKSNAAAKLLAGKFYRDETKGRYPLEFYAMYFGVRVAEPKVPGKPSQRILPTVKE